MSNIKDSPPSGYVKIELEGNLIRTGSKIERIAGNGERILEGFDFAQTCPWVEQLRGDRRYSGAECNSVKKEKNVLDGSIALGNGLFLDGKAECDADGKYLVKTESEWEKHFASSGKRIPTVGEYIQTFKRLHEQKDPPALQGIIQDLLKSRLCAGKINYDKSNLPLGSDYVDELIKDPAWRRPLEDELFQYDVSKAVKVMQTISKKRLYILTPSASGRKAMPERAVWLLIDAGRFGLSCSDGPIYLSGRARGVRRESA